MAEFRMPSLGADMEEGTLVEWLVQPGDAVARGDIVAVVDTAKAAIDVECFETGVIERLLVEPGAVVPVGTPLAIIGTGAPSEPAPPAPPPEPAATAPVPAAAPAEPAPAPSPDGPARRSPDGPVVTSPLVRRMAAEHHVDLSSVQGTGVGGRVTHADIAQARTAAEPAQPAPATPAAAPAETPAPEVAGRRVRISPLARKLAAELGVDLSGVAGTGPGGSIDAEDVRRAATEPAPAPVRAPAAAAPVAAAKPASEVKAPAARAAGTESAAEAAARRAAAMRSTIAALMARSKREIPHYYLTETVDLGPAVAWLTARNRQLPIPQRLVPAALLLKAAARAAAVVKELNGFWIDDAFVPAPAVHLGVAVSLRGGGLVAPAIHNADTLSLSDLMAKLRDLVARVRVGKLRGAEMSDPTITISNLGDQGVEAIHGVIYPPQVALVGYGTVVDRPWAVDGLLGVRPTVVVTLAADHRATDGATGARYLRTVVQLLHKPEEL